MSVKRKECTLVLIESEKKKKFKKFEKTVDF